MGEPEFLEVKAGRVLAFRRRSGRGPTLVFLPGYMSDMEGGKAAALDAWAASEGRAMLRFDYSGCGASDGTFEAQILADLDIGERVHRSPLARPGRHRNITASRARRESRRGRG